ncbi:MAG: DUF4199 domain-containing protein [Candidatus Eisenbacteria bacterium]
MKKTVLKFGLIAGGIMSALMLATIPFMHSLANEWGMVIGYTGMTIAFLFIYFGVRSYRDQVAGGRIGFMKALGVGLLIGVLASSCYVLTWEIMYFRGPNDFIEKYQAKELEGMRANGATEAQLAAKQVEMDKMAAMYHNPLINSAMTFMEPLPVAIVFALATAGIVSRRRKEQVPATA